MDENLQDHPEASAYRHKCLGYYDDLCKIRAVGAQAESSRGQGPLGTVDGKYDTQESGGDGTSIDHQYPSLHSQPTHQQGKRPGSDSSAEKPAKILRTAVRLPADDRDVTAITKGQEERKRYTVEGAISVLQAITDVDDDDDLLLDACDLLEDERKAKIFLALDASLRKRWLLRKLRP